MNYKHGKTDTREFRIWTAMKKRCFSPAAAFYSHYGGRGITVCPRWRDSFTDFLADMGQCPPNYSIERRDNDGNYEPGNCCWLPSWLQSRNTRKNVWLEWHGRRQLAADWAREFGISAKRFHYLSKARGFDVATIERIVREGLDGRRGEI